MPTARFALFALLTALAAAFLGGCSSSQTSGSANYTEAFKAGRYADAYESASKQATLGSGPKKDQASLIAGLSAHALNRNDDAEKFLTPVVGNADPKMAGEAGAALGLIAAERGQHDKAAEYLTQAGRKLTGDDAARAFLYAGDSYKSLGKTTEARGMWSLAQTNVVNDSALRVMIGDRLSAAATPPPPAASPNKAAAATRYSVQVGAFSNYTNAQAQVSRYRAYGAARVVETHKNGKKLFVVRVGTYATKAEADRVKKTIGSSAVVVTTAGE
ncbi:MAG: SPOR domain-containing protein [Planctomycetes bacterium]|nr:SPOR domain-containing protein [Planctomycetota bacterium]